MNYFYGVYPKNRGLRVFLDLLRFVAEPTAIRFSHITLRGPYKQRLPRARLDELNSSIGSTCRVMLLGPGRFFSEKQHTVFLDVDVSAIRSVWHKPDYPDGNGHITMYDGRIRAEALRIYDLLSHYDWRMGVSITPIQPLEPKVGENDGLLAQMTAIHRAYEKFSAGDLPPLRDLSALSFNQRMTIYAKLLERSELPVNQEALLARA